MLRKLAVLITCTGLTLSPLSAYALGFGGIKLKSSLNEHLNAEVALLSATPSDIQSLKIKLATDEAFQRAGIARNVFLNNLDFEVKQYANGDYYIHLSTDTSVREPFLDFLLDINWKNGRMLREYTMLMDPPNRTSKQQAKAASGTEIPTQQPVQPPVEKKKLSLAEKLATQTPVYAIAEPTTVEPVAEVVSEPVVEPTPEPEKIVEPVAEVIKPAPIAEAVPDRAGVNEEVEPSDGSMPELFDPGSAFSEEDSGELWPRIPLTLYSESGSSNSQSESELGNLDYGITKADDNLWNIAEKLRQGNKNITIYQVMMALLQSNPDAFVDNNVHRLKVGHVLRINDSAALMTLTKKEAANAYIKQTGIWNNYRQQTQATAETSVQPIIASKEIDLATTDTDNSSGELILSSPDGESLVSGGGVNEEVISNDLATMQDQLRQTKADAGTMRTRNVELNKRLQLLGDELNRLQRSISVKDDELAALQYQLSTTDKPVMEKVEDAVATEEAVVEKENLEKPPEVKAAEPAKTTKPVVDVIPEPYVEPGFMGMLMGVGAAIAGVFAGDSLLFIAPLLLVLLIIAGIIIRRKRQGDKFQESILTGSTTAVDSVAGSTSDMSEESSFLSDFAMSGAGAIETDDSEVDPLTEADVFIAYGRYEAAEERLNEAVQNEPERMDLRAKLLEVHHATQNKDEFESGAEDFYASLGGDEIDNPLWEKVVSMGVEIAPENPLFVQDAVEDNVSSDDEPEENAEPDVAAMSDSEVMDIGLETGVFESNELAGEDSSSMDFNLDLDELEVVSEDESSNSEDDMDFNLDLDDTKENTSDENVDMESNNLDFNIDMTDDSATEELTTDIDMTATESIEDVSLDFNLDTGTELDETNLDLDITTTDSSDDNALDFSLDSSDEDRSLIDLDTSAEEPESSDENSLDFNLDISGDESESTSNDDDLSLDLDLGDDSSGDELPLDIDTDDIASGDEVGTKLDLAKAYIDMGDPEGARSILSEVMDEGSDTQKEEAQELLGQIV